MTQLNEFCDWILPSTIQEAWITDNHLNRCTTDWITVLVMIFDPLTNDVKSCVAWIRVWTEEVNSVFVFVDG